MDEANIFRWTVVVAPVRLSLARLPYFHLPTPSPSLSSPSLAPCHARPATLRAAPLLCHCLRAPPPSPFLAALGYAYSRSVGLGHVSPVFIACGMQQRRSLRPLLRVDLRPRKELRWRRSCPFCVLAALSTLVFPELLAQSLGSV